MSDSGELIGVIPKTERADVRVYRKTHKGRAIIDICIWWTPEVQTGFVPSRRGVSFDASKADLLRQALETMP